MQNITQKTLKNSVFLVKTLKNYTIAVNFYNYNKFYYVVINAFLSKCTLEQLTKNYKKCKLLMLQKRKNYG